MSCHFSAKINSLVLTMHKTLLIDWLTYVQNILQPSFVGPRHLPIVPKPYNTRPWVSLYATGRGCYETDMRKKLDKSNSRRQRLIDGDDATNHVSAPRDVTKAGGHVTRAVNYRRVSQIATARC